MIKKGKNPLFLFNGEALPSNPQVGYLEENEQLKNNPTIDNFISWVHKIENAKKEYLANLDHFE